MKKYLFLLFLILIVALSFAVYFGSIILVKNVQSSRAETMSEKFVTSLYSEYSILGKNCQGEDVDGDSYVSCDVRIIRASDNQNEKTIHLQCPTLWKSYLGSTCKESRNIITD